MFAEVTHYYFFLYFTAGYFIRLTQLHKDFKGVQILHLTLRENQATFLSNDLGISYFNRLCIITRTP